MGRDGALCSAGCGFYKPFTLGTAWRPYTSVSGKAAGPCSLARKGDRHEWPESWTLGRRSGSRGGAGGCRGRWWGCDPSPSLLPRAGLGSERDRAPGSGLQLRECRARAEARACASQDGGPDHGRDRRRGRPRAGGHDDDGHQPGESERLAAAGGAGRARARRGGRPRLHVPGSGQGANGRPAAQGRSAADLRLDRGEGPRPRAARVRRLQPHPLERLPRAGPRHAESAADLREPPRRRRQPRRLRPAAQRIARVQGAVEDLRADQVEDPHLDRLLAQPQA